MPCTTVQDKPFIGVIALDFIYSISFKQPGIFLVFPGAKGSLSTFSGGQGLYVL